MEGRLLPFTHEAVERVPRATGTYFLFRDGEPVCVGVAAGGATLQSELFARLAASRPGGPTHFAWLAAADAMQAYRRQLAAYATVVRPADGYLRLSGA